MKIINFENVDFLSRLKNQKNLRKQNAVRKKTSERL
jgi:hypothetical protein